MSNKPTIMITFRENGENGGPYTSHKRIMESSLKEKYNFVPFIIPGGHIGVFNLKLIKRLKEDIVYIRPDIIHFTGLQLEGFYVALACKLAKFKNTVLAIHGSSLEACEFSFFKRNILNILEIITMKLSSMCYGVSDYVCRWKRVNIFSNKCFGTIYNLPINVVNADNIEETSFRKEIGANKEDILIVSTGRITKEKGYDILLNCIKKMNISSKVKFIIVGDGEYSDIMKKELEKFNLESSVYMLGYRNDIKRILKECDIFILCTLHETLCNSIIEAAHEGLPSIVSNVGGIPEIIEHGKSGLLIPVNDVNATIEALNILINNKGLREDMGRNAKTNIVTKFSTEKILNKIDQMYRSLLNDSQ